VATHINNREECAEGATVVLLNISGEKIAECVTDNYGDFKFDNLDENSGKYSIQIRYGDKSKSIEAELTKSINAGVTYL
jgi:hypothetical protein